ncbi:hypothetical protein FCV25MIE_16478, partial [Fagus crenata]
RVYLQLGLGKFSFKPLFVNQIDYSPITTQNFPLSLLLHRRRSSSHENFYRTWILDYVISLFVFEIERDYFKISKQVPGIALSIESSHIHTFSCTEALLIICCKVCIKLDQESIIVFKAVRVVLTSCFLQIEEFRPRSYL